MCLHRALWSGRCLESDESAGPMSRALDSPCTTLGRPLVSPDSRAGKFCARPTGASAWPATARCLALGFSKNASPLFGGIRLRTSLSCGQTSASREAADMRDE
jgi:hypothetical protein